MPYTPIDEYVVLYAANSFFPRIWLKHSGVFIGQLIFEPNGNALPPDAASGGQVSLYYHLADFQNCLDLLRHEKPMYLLFSGSGGGFENGIQTTPEPVGT
jgi:hypothetical protein